MKYDPANIELLGPVPHDAGPAAPPVSVVQTGTGGERAMGGAFDGASRFDKSIALWAPALKSADRDILPEKRTIDARSRDTLRNDAYVAGGANLHRDGIVGASFMLNSKPALYALGKPFDETWEEEFQQEVEEKFTLAAESPDCWLDAAGRNGLTAMTRLAVGVYVAAGEFLASAEWIREAGRPFNTAVQLVDTDRLSDPPTKTLTDRISGGVETNGWGRPIAYHIRRAHPSDIGNVDAWKWDRIAAKKPWGRPQIIHIFEQQRVAQSRGVAEMVAALKELRITKKFRDIVLQNAVVNASYAASIESDLPTETVFQALGANLDPEKVQEVITNYAEGYLGAISEYAGGSKALAIDGVKIPHLFPGTKFNLKPAGSGSPTIDFEQSLLRYIAAILGVSYEELSRDYTKTNYSSARASMANSWKFMQSRKKMTADRFATTVFRLWLEEALNKGEIQSMPRLPVGWLYQGQNLDALSMCDWIGASRGQIDELKETQAAVLRINNGLSTLEYELARLGMDYRKVLRQLSREEKLKTQYGVLLTPTDTTNQENASTGARGTSATAMVLTDLEDRVQALEEGAQ